MKKGFTLIELLAVIVILAIIALIATPIILGIINDARDEANQRTAELIGKEIQLAYTSYMFEEDAVAPASDCDYMTSEYFAMDGVQKIECAEDVATITMDNNVVYTATYADTAGSWTVTSSKASNGVDLESNVTVQIATN